MNPQCRQGRTARDILNMDETGLLSQKRNLCSIQVDNEGKFTITPNLCS